MNIPKLPTWAWVAGAGFVGLAVWRLASVPKRESTGSPVVDFTAALVEALARASSDVAGGAVQGVAGLIGVPKTSQQGCCEAIQAYNAATGTWQRVKATFAISGACPAGDYLAWASGKGAPDYCAAAVPEVVKPAPGSAPKKRGGASGSWSFNEWATDSVFSGELAWMRNTSDLEQGRVSA